MFTDQAARGRGVAKAILTQLETVARDAGMALLRLETGVHQHDAIAFYERMGFRECGAFGDYAAMTPSMIETSVFYEKRL
jgi:putative acetyltransferase